MIRHTVSIAAVALACCGLTGQQVAAQDVSARSPVETGLAVITLGTGGGPPPRMGRAQPATALVVGGRRYLIDAGEGAGHQLMQAGIRPARLDAIFITHLHWDHTLGLDYIMATDWMLNRMAQVPVIGPAGTGYLMSRQIAAVEVGEAIFRAQATYRPALASLYPVREVIGCAEREVYRDEVVRVRATCNSHFAELSAGQHAYGEDVALSYRFDTAHGAVTFTGDTGPSAELDTLAAGSDVLVAEVVDLPSIRRALELASPGSDISGLMVHMEHQHLTTADIGQLATRAGVTKVILTHFVIGAGLDVDMLADQVRAHFDGEVLIGQDLQRFTLDTPAG